MGDFVETVTVFDSDGDNTAQAAKLIGGYLSYINVYNPNAAVAFLQLFDVATGSVTVGSTTPKQSYFIPAQGAFERSFETPLHFHTAITYACTTTATGSTDPTTGLTVNLVIY